MSMLARLFKKKPVIELDDSVFGHITCEQGSWTFIPDPPTAGFMITIDGTEKGPTQEQRMFFQQVRSRLADFEQRARDYMRSRVDDIVEVSRLSTYAVEIGNAEKTEGREFVLELSDSDASIIHRVTFSGDEAVNYGCDD